MPPRTAPVTEICAAFDTWAEATGSKDWPTRFQAHKSNLLYRLIYLGEPLRTEKCPVHEGRWSGCSWGDALKTGWCDCQKVRTPDGRVGYDSNVCGWLLDGNPPVDDYPA